MAQTGTGVIVVLHDLSSALQLCTRLLLVHQGRVDVDGLPDDVIDAARTQEAFALKPLRMKTATGEVGVLWSSMS